MMPEVTSDAPRAVATGTRRQISVAVVLLVVTCGGGTASAQRQEPAPGQLEEVGIDERLNGQVPLDLRFRDERDREVRLGRYFQDRPVILSLTYSDCPMLCHLQLDGLVQGPAGTQFGSWRGLRDRQREHRSPGINPPCSAHKAQACRSLRTAGVGGRVGTFLLVTSPGSTRSLRR